VSAQRRIVLDLRIDDSPVSSETTCVWAGPYVLAIATVLPDEGLAAEVHSVFVGHAGVPTCATHLTLGLGPIGRRPRTITSEHARSSLDPTVRVRECVYEHVTIMLEALKILGYEVGIDVPDDAFEELESVEA
jgi:hypothetical protein